MSARGRGDKIRKRRPSIEGDQYYTPHGIARQCVENVVMRWLKPQTVLEPSCGEGVLAKMMADQGCRVTSVDPHQDQCPGSSEHHKKRLEDFLPDQQGRRWDLVIANPPFSPALEHIQMCLAVADACVFLVRQGFTASAKRYPFFLEHPPAREHVITSRPRFDVPDWYLEKYPENEFGKWSSDSADYVWLTWIPKTIGTTQKFWLPPVKKENRS